MFDIIKKNIGIVFVIIIIAVILFYLGGSVPKFV